MCKYATTDDSVEALAKTLLYFIMTPRSDKMLLTPLVRNAFVSLATHATAPMSVGYVSNAIENHVLRRAVPLFLDAHTSATTSVRDALVTMAPFATPPAAVQSLSSALRAIMKALFHGCSGRTRGSQNLTDEFVTPTVIDAIISMSQFATTSSSVLSLMIAFGVATSVFLRLNWAIPSGSFRGPSRRGFHGMIANKGVCGTIISLAKFATTPEAIAYLGGTVYVFDGQVNLWSTFFANEAFRDAFVLMAPLAASTSASHGLAKAMLAIVERVPKSVELFACVEVLRGCGHLRRYTNDSDEARECVDRLLQCLITCGKGGVNFPNDVRVPENERDNTIDEVSQCVGAAMVAFRRDPMRTSDAIPSYPTSSTLRQSDQLAPSTTIQLPFLEHSDGWMLFPHQFAAVVVDLMYCITPTVPLSRAANAAMLSSGGCRQGHLLGPLTVSLSAHRILHSGHEAFQEAAIGGAPPFLLQCFVNDATVVVRCLDYLHGARAFFRRLILILSIIHSL